MFYRRDDGTLEPFDPDIHANDEVAPLADQAGDQAVTIAETAEGATAAEFYLEAHLEDFLIANSEPHRVGQVPRSLAQRGRPRGPPTQHTDWPPRLPLR